MQAGIGSLRMKRLAACLSASLGLAGNAQAVTFVTTCADDSSAGTLRSILAVAANNDVIDLSTQSNCSSITLTRGEIPIAVSVTLLGPAIGTFTVNGAHNGRVFHSTFVSPGYDNLNIGNLTITGGRVYAGGGSAPGGCILSGNLNLQNSIVSDCVAGTAGASNSGGAVRANKVYLSNSHIQDSAVYAAGIGAFAVGGGVGADSLFNCVNSTITGNKALAPMLGEGGGIQVNAGSLYMKGCTVDNNISQYAGGVLQFGGPTDTAVIINSTISGNYATKEDGGIFTGSPLTLTSSTVAFNRADYACAGLRSYQPITMKSSIVANNRTPSAVCVDVYSAGPIAGVNNLITVAYSGSPPATIHADPKLTPLADHGGPTFTHGLSLSSPAIDQGNNAAALGTDQRGPGFGRAIGAAADIGAFERQPGDDEIFYGGVE